MLFRSLGFTNRALTQASTGATDMMGSVLAVNYDTGEMLISLGTGQGIRAKTESEGTELEALLLEDVDPATGAGTSRQTIEDERIVGRSLDGKGFEEWIEVQRVLGPNLCIGIPKHKVKKFLNSSTETAWSAVARLAAPNSGLLRVKIAPKTGAR